MRAGDLAVALGFDNLPLSPRSLPPGRIMAYAPCDRFMSPEAVFYVLSEWVEDRQNRKNRIPADRVITPRVWKQIVLDPLVVRAAAESDATFQTCGILDTGVLATALAHKLPDKPTEPFFIDIIDRMLEAQISPWLHSLGKGIFVDSRHISISTMQGSDAKKTRAIETVVASTQYRIRERWASPACKVAVAGRTFPNILVMATLQPCLGRVANSFIPETSYR
jgi:hypothetical protein